MGIEERGKPDALSCSHNAHAKTVLVERAQ
jgi:hypothetical protein